MSDLYRQVPTMLVVGPLAFLLLALLLGQLYRRRGLTPLRVLVAVVVCGYVGGVVANTVLPIYLAKPDYDVPWDVYLHLTPFRGTEVSDYVQNVVVFLPLGILLPLVTRTRSVLRVLLGGFALSLLMETSQFVNAVALQGGHVADVNDLIANTLGAPLGYGLFTLAVRIPVIRRLVHDASYPTARPAHSG